MKSLVDVRFLAFHAFVKHKPFLANTNVLFAKAVVAENSSTLFICRAKSVRVLTEFIFGFSSVSTNAFLAFDVALFIVFIAARLVVEAVVSEMGS